MFQKKMTVIRQKIVRTTPASCRRWEKVCGRNTVSWERDRSGSMATKATHPFGLWENPLQMKHLSGDFFVAHNKWSSKILSGASVKTKSGIKWTALGRSWTNFFENSLPRLLRTIPRAFDPAKRNHKKISKNQSGQICEKRSVGCGWTGERARKTESTGEENYEISMIPQEKWRVVGGIKWKWISTAFMGDDMLGIIIWVWGNSTKFVRNWTMDARRGKTKYRTKTNIWIIGGNSAIIWIWDCRTCAWRTHYNIQV